MIILTEKKRIKTNSRVHRNSSALLYELLCITSNYGFQGNGFQNLMI